MPREAARTTTKSKMKLSATSLNLPYRKSHTNIAFENPNVIYIFHVIRCHVLNFCSHVSKRTDSKMFRI